MMVCLNCHRPLRLIDGDFYDDTGEQLANYCPRRMRLSPIGHMMIFLPDLREPTEIEIWLAL